VLQATAAEIRAATGADVLALVIDIAKQGDPERLIAETVKRFRQARHSRQQRRTGSVESLRYRR